MADIVDQPGSFYLGKEYDLTSSRVLDEPVWYNARDLTTHGVVVGMTGSGKTGLCINLLEEAALNRIPSIIIDPKGDLGNLMLQFPDLEPKSFLPWLNTDDAAQRGVTPDEYAAQVADSWRRGLSDWGQGPQRIAKLKEQADWRIYTPGSEAGLPLSILQTFTAPKGKVTREALNQKIDATTTALLGLSGIQADPVQSREHILIAQLLLHAWSAGHDLDLPLLIRQIQAPPLHTIGAFEVETFYPEKERLKLAVALNNILAAPSFSTWIAGEPLDLSRMLYSGDKARQLIFHIAHLEDAQRLFFLTLLLEEVLNWTRAQPGTSSLRAILYFDEVYGYLPPYPANPPTKTPLMTLLKQARAFGVGVLLATQNPVDLDYKALSNAGTWFVGKLQTERDKARLIEGLEGAASQRGALGDRARLDSVISGLSSRVFLLHDVHRAKPQLFHTRWALSYLGGPMTRDQVAVLAEPIKRLDREKATVEQGPPAAIPLCPSCQAELGHAQLEQCPACGASLPAPQCEGEGAAKKAPEQAASVRPAQKSASAAPVHLAALSPASSASGAELFYQPRVLGVVEINFMDKRKGLAHRRTFGLLADPPADGSPLAWDRAEPLSDFGLNPPPTGAGHGEASQALNAAKNLKALERGLLDHWYSRARLVLHCNRALDLCGEPEQELPSFLEQCRSAARQQAAEAIAVEKAKYRIKFELLNISPRFDRERPGEGRGAQSEKSGAESHAHSILDWFSSLLGGNSEEKTPAVAPLAAKDRAKLTKLQAEWDARLKVIGEKWTRIAEEHSEIVLTPRRADVRVTQLGIAWAPFWRVPSSAGGVATLIAAYQRSGEH